MSLEHAFEQFWLPKAIRLHKKYPKEFSRRYTKQDDPQEIALAVQNFEAQLLVKSYIAKLVA